MKTTREAAVLAAAAVMMGAGMAGAVSDPVFVNTSQTENRYWETVHTNEVDVAWRWENTNAVSAELSVSGMNGTVMLTNITRSVSNVLWRVFSQDVPKAEEVYDLALTFYGSGGLVVGAQTSRLAVVTGAFGETKVIPSPEGTPWPKITENAVIPYDAGWAEATSGAPGSQLVISKVGGAIQTNTLADTAGFFGWKIKRSDWGYGTFNLALTFPGMEGEWDGTLARVPEGFMFSVR